MGRGLGFRIRLAVKGDIAVSARMVAEHRGVHVVGYLSELLRAKVEEDAAEVMRDTVKKIDYGPSTSAQPGDGHSP
jgi:hypothetical protein